MKTIGARSAAWVLGMTGLLLAGLLACGSDDKEDDDSTDTKLSFTTDVNPILKASCAGSTCHDVGSSGTQYVDKETAFKAAATSAKAHLDAGTMPKSPSTISAADKQKLLDFLAQ